MVRKPTVITRSYFWSGLLFFLLVSSGLLYSAAAGWRYLRSEQQQPVTELLLQGERHQVSAQQLRSVLEPDLSHSSLLTVDVDRVRQQLEQLPWVQGISVRKRWPRGLSIYLTEREALARWQVLAPATDVHGSEQASETVLLDPDGVVFAATPGVEHLRLPLLQGPAGSEQRVLSMWQPLSEGLALGGMNSAGLALQADGSWILQRDDGLQLLLGSEQPLERLGVYLQVAHLLPREAPGDGLTQSEGSKSNKLDHDGTPRRAVYLDLRYDTGLAIGWQPEATAN